MILRKPYAYLIKKFKLIHFILAGLMFYLIFRTNNVLTYFRDYVNRGTLNRVLASDYINLFMFFVTFLIIGIGIIIYLLMRFKKKPKTVYLISIIGYFVSFIILWYTLSVMKELEFTILDTRIIRIVRDLLLFSTIFQIGIIVIVLIRALGFDIKKFNFADDIAELNIEVSDNEEFELIVGIDSNKITRKARRKGREFKYFILENKFIFTLVCIIFISLVSFIVFLNVLVFNKVYKEGDNFRTSLYTMNILDSYYTTKKYDGTVIKTNDKVFVILKLKLKGIYKDLILSKDDMRLMVGNDKYYPNIKYYEYFSDIGVGYNKQKIDTKEKEYILIYMIDKTNINKKMVLNYVDQVKFTNTGIEAKYKKVSIKPTSLDTSVLEDSVLMPNELNLSSSILGNSSIKINGYEIDESFDYEYKNCINNKCNNVKGIIAANSNYGKKADIMSLDISYDGNLSINDFFNKFAKVYYINNGVKRTYEYGLVINTPSNYTGNKTFITVDSLVRDADVVWLEFNIREKKYNYVLKTNNLKS